MLRHFLETHLLLTVLEEMVNTAGTYCDSIAVAIFKKPARKTMLFSPFNLETTFKRISLLQWVQP